MLKLLTVIPARGGSKRLPGKNTRLLGGKPLIQWSIDTAKALPEALGIIVSTDDASIAEIAVRGGASVPWLRPPELSGDEAKSVDVALHALDWYEKHAGEVDGLLLLQPTSPFRRMDSVRRGLDLFDDDRTKAIVSFSQATHHPAWCFHISGDRAEPFMGPEFMTFRSQDLPPAYAINGAFYLISPALLRRHRSFFPLETRPLVMHDPAESVDIDTAGDWRIAESYAEKSSP